MGGRSGVALTPRKAPVRRSLKKTDQKQPGRASGRPFKAGESGNPKGRPRGVSNKATVEAKAACAAIVDDPVYRRKLKAAALARKLPPAVEMRSEIDSLRAELLGGDRRGA